MKIRITPPDGTPRELDFDSGTTTIGRAEDCTITLNERTVSRNHAEIHMDETDTLIVRDAGSRYGTLLNGRLVQEPSPFYPGDVLNIGGFVFELPGDTVDLDPITGEMETRRIRKDTTKALPAIPIPSHDRNVMLKRILSWLWVILLLAGLAILGLLLADYLSEGGSPDGGAMYRAPAPTAKASQAFHEDASWTSFVHSS
jgi:pSer/pThr/pTyr-binding forkhead associated (FHA) protein